MSDTLELVARYVGVWGEPDDEQRRKTIEGLWAANGVHLLQPPEEIRDAASSLGFTSTVLQATGYDELEYRVTRTYQEFVADGKYSFRPAGDPVRLENLVKFSWEMVSIADDEVVGGGQDVLLLDEHNRILTDYQLPNP